MAGKDVTEKTLEAYGDVFADIVNGLLFNGEQVLTEQSLTDAQPFSMYKEDGSKLHEQERDVAKYWVDQKGERVNVRIAMLGIAAFCAGASVFMFYGCVAATKGLVRLTKKMALGLKSLIIGKERSK